MERILKVRYTKWPPWAMTVPSRNGTALEGVLKDVFEALSHSLKYNFAIEDQKDQVFGARLPNGTYSGMLGALARKEVDIAGPYSASEQRAMVADFTNCLEFSRLGIITGIESADRNMFLYFKVFTWQVWLSLIASVAVCGLVSVLLYDLAVNGWKANQGLLLSRYFWVFWSYLLGHDAGTINHWALREMWFKHTFRLLLAAWLLGPVINSLYTFQGAITSTFAITKLTPVISDLEHLTQRKKVVPVIPKGSAVEICFKTSTEHSHLWERMQNNSIRFAASTVQDTLIKVEKGTHILIVDYIYALSIAADWVKRKGRCSLQVEELLFCQNFIALALRKGFDHDKKKKINAQLTYIIQAKLTDRWINRVLNNYTHCTRLPSEGSKPLSVTDVVGGLAMWGAGATSAMLMFLVELLAHNKSQKQKSNERETPELCKEENDELSLKNYTSFQEE